MKPLKTLVLTLTAAVLFTGCYTQLQYSQRMTKVTDQRELEQYAENGEPEAAESGEYVETTADLTAYAETGNIPVYYKNYYVSDWWNDCLCSPYGYNRYSGFDFWYYDRYSFRTSFGFGHYGHPSYYTHYYYNPYFRWNLRHHRWSRLGSGFAFSWRWGYHYPHYYRYHYYDPFLYNYYGYPVAFNNFYYFGGGSGFVGGNDVQAVNRRNGPRSIGTDRVVRDSNRARDTQNARVNRGAAAGTTTAPRTVGTTRTRDNARNGASTVNRVRNDSGNRSATGRTRGTVQRGNDQQRGNGTVQRGNGSASSPEVRSRNSRDNNISSDEVRRRSRVISLEDYVNADRTANDRKIRQRLRNSRIPASAVNGRKNSGRKTFLNRVGSFINNSRRVLSNGSTTTRSVKIKSSSRSRSSRSVTRSRNSGSGSRGTVSKTRSRSSSSGSGNSRSRSGGGGSSGSSSDRSRGNN